MVRSSPGRRFVSAASWRLDAEIAAGAAEVRVRTPPGEPGFVDVTVEPPSDVALLVSDGFTYPRAPADPGAASDLPLDRFPLALADVLANPASLSQCLPTRRNSQIARSGAQLAAPTARPDAFAEIA